MRHIAAYLLLQLGGNSSPNAGDIKKLLSAVGIEADEARLSTLVSELEGKDTSALINEGLSKLASVPSGGGAASAAPAAGGGGGAAAAVEKKEEKKEEEKEESDEVTSTMVLFTKLWLLGYGFWLVRLKKTVLIKFSYHFTLLSLCTLCVSFVSRSLVWP